MSTLSDPIWIVCVATPYTTQSPACDPAIDTSDPDCAHAMMRYVRSRSEADREALPLRPGAKPVLWQVKPLRSAHLRYIDEASGPVERAHRAFLCACHAVRIDGVDRTAKVMASGGKFELADDAWLEEVFAEFGDDRIAEVGAVAIQRAKAGPHAVDPFALPVGLRLRP